MQLIALLVAAAWMPSPAFAHGAGGASAGQSGEIASALVLALAVYAVAKSRRRGRRSVVLSACYAAGMAALAAALLPPFDRLADDLFAAHMAQHLILMFVAAPLLVMSDAFTVLPHLLPRAWRRRPARLSASVRRSAALPWIAGTAFCVAMVFWHLPAPYQGARDSDLLHAVEHMSLLVVATMFWFAVKPGGVWRAAPGANLLLVSAVGIVSGLPGALMIFAGRPLYPGHAEGAARWSLTLLEDQQLAGVLMWIPAGLVFLLAAAWAFAAWMREAERRATAAVPVAVFAAIVAAGVVSWSKESAAQGTGIGDVQRGRVLVRQYGCGACHAVPGLPEARGVVGPSLATIGRRVYIAGVLRNSTDNMMRWLQDPQQVVPGNAMPNMNIDRRDARDLTAYLATLR